MIKFVIWIQIISCSHVKVQVFCIFCLLGVISYMNVLCITFVGEVWIQLRTLSFYNTWVIISVSWIANFTFLILKYIIELYLKLLRFVKKFWTWQILQIILSESIKFVQLWVSVWLWFIIVNAIMFLI
jgi:hypothetical protein